MRTSDMETLHTNVLVNSERRGEGRVVCKENAVIAGMEEAFVLLELAGCKGTAKAHDGDRIKARTIILSVRGPARALLRVERTLLNLLSHMSGVATARADLVSIANRESRGRGPGAGTKRELPGVRFFGQEAVEVGGRGRHRLTPGQSLL